jgi:hypothetical protein
MKIRSLLLATFLILLPVSGWAFDPTPYPERVLLLDAKAPYDRGGLRTALLKQMGDDLRDKGFEVFETDSRFHELTREDVAGADYLIELAGERAHSADYGGVGVGVRHADIGLSIVGSRVVARLLVYDAPTMELLGERTLTQSASALLPSSVGFGSRMLYAFVGLPLIESAQHRSLARSIGREAAAFAAATIRSSPIAEELSDR